MLSGPGASAPSFTAQALFERGTQPFLPAGALTYTTKQAGRRGRPERTGGRAKPAVHPAQPASYVGCQP